MCLYRKTYCEPLKSFLIHIFMPIDNRSKAHSLLPPGSATMDTRYTTKSKTRAVACRMYAVEIYPASGPTDDELSFSHDKSDITNDY